LTRSHRLSTKESREYYPKIERLKEMTFVPRKCGVVGCREHTVFAKRGNLKRHIEKVHKLTDDQMKQYLY
jgi:hypothetical protein